MSLKYREDAAVEELLQRMQIPFTVETVDFDKVDIVASEKNEARLTRPKDERTILNYTECMARGDTFPMMVWMRFAQPDNGEKEFKILAGLHRFPAAKNLKETAAKAYVVMETGEIVSDLLPRILNYANGRTVDEADMVSQGMYLMDRYRLTVTQVADYLAVKRGPLDEAIRLKQNISILEREHVKMDTTILCSTAVRKISTLTNITVRVAVANAAVHLRLGTNGISALVNAVKAHPESETAQLSVVQDYLKQHKPSKPGFKRRKKDLKEKFNSWVLISTTLFAGITKLVQLQIEDYEEQKTARKSLREIRDLLTLLAKS